jgi:hypothetical protein
MYRYLYRISLPRIGLVIALMIAIPAVASAQDQDQFQLPTQIVPESPQTEPSPPSHNSETIPSNPVVAQPFSPPPMPYQAPQNPPPAEAPPSPMEETQPILPDIFRGCWRGEVDNLDAILPMPGGARLGTWTPKTYRICYQRYGSEPYQLTFNETAVAPDSRIVSPAGTMRLLSSHGSTAMMLGSLHFEEYFPVQASFFGFANPGPGTFPVDETTKLRCIVAPDGMHVWATVDGNREGVPWFRAYWHALFYPVPA